MNAGFGSAAPRRWLAARQVVGARGLAAIILVSIAWGCGTQAVPSPSPAATPVTTAASTPTATPSPTYADTLRIGWSCSSTLAINPCTTPGYRTGFSDTSQAVVTPGGVIYSGLYRWDATMAAIPDLADGPCTPGGTGMVIRCRLVETTFHDGTPLAAADVAFSVNLQGGWPTLKDVIVVDPRTVDFELSAVDPTFVTEALPAVAILPQRAVEAAYAAFRAATNDLKAADLSSLADAIDAETGADPPVCTPRLDAAAKLLEQLTVRLYREDYQAGGTFDPCGYMETASSEIRQAAHAIDATGMDGLSAAFSLFGTSWQPVSAGPYRFVSASAGRVHLEAFAGYHGGVAATRYLDFVPANSDGSDLVAGATDVEQEAALGDNSTFAATAGARGIAITRPPSRGFTALQFNVRPGRLFADVALRRALQLCVDLPRDVAAATGGAGTPVYGPVLAGSWAYDANLPSKARDVAAAKQLIAGSGWQLGADGMFAKGGVSLAADVVVWGTQGYRTHMIDLIGDQARECGMDIRNRPTDFNLAMDMINRYPHDIPGTATPFDLYIGTWIPGPDPAESIAYFVSANISDAQHPENQVNFIGFTDPALDRLDAAAKATYDQAERAGLYRQAQEELAAQVPYLFLWTSLGYDAVRTAVRSADGQLDLTVPNWSWQPERMVVARR
jgi:ABC-type transport system substrate-binding protein